MIATFRWALPAQCRWRQLYSLTPRDNPPMWTTLPHCGEQNPMILPTMREVLSDQFAVRAPTKYKNK